MGNVILEVKFKYLPAANKLRLIARGDYIVYRRPFTWLRVQDENCQTSLLLYMFD